MTLEEVTPNMDYSNKIMSKPLRNIGNLDNNIRSKIKLNETLAKVEPKITAADSTGIENTKGI